ncbi:MAG: helix-turn-helix domain containing protein [Caulobacteraceae bacterium]|nr:helix-turn-helix domain containing protein [Caulobacteraceae bacterium]
MSDAPAPISARDTPKSVRTRKRILDCAMRLFVEIGYGEATNARIAEEARLTRGAMLYHFPTREALVEAAAEHIHAARSKLMAEASAKAPAGADRAEHAIDVYWAMLNTPPFVAFAELEAVARTDPAVAERLAPYREAFDRAQVGEQLLGLFSAGVGPRFQASRDLARFMLEGLSRATLTYDAEGRVQRLLAVIKRATHMLNRKGSVQDLWPEEPPTR